MVEFSPITIGELRQRRKDNLYAFAQQICDACTNVIFFYVINHGIAQSVFDSTLDASPKFFRLPEEEKKNCHKCK
jgi:isopenicillin N synthase-like dioxygenase